MRLAISLGAGVLSAAFAVAALAADRPAPAAAKPVAAKPAACNETCLKGYMDRFLAALTAHDPKGAPFARTVRYTEDGALIEPGEALWVGFGGVGKYRHDFYDTETGQVGAYLSMTENGARGLLSVRLKVAGGKITEVETVVSRNNRNADRIEGADPAWFAAWGREEPAKARLTRAQLEQGAVNYLRAVAFHDGKIGKFAEDCLRLENGAITALGPNETHPPVPEGGGPGGAAPAVPATATTPAIPARPNTSRMGCGGQIDSLTVSFIQGYDGAHFPLIDVKRQVVFGTFNFVRRGNVKAFIEDGNTYPIGAGMRVPNEAFNAEAWKFVGGKISKVEAVLGGGQAFARGTGWPSHKRVMRPIDDTAGGRLILEEASKSD